MTTIRKIKTDDAARFLKLNLALDEDSKFMMVEPGERQPIVQDQFQRIVRAEKNRNSVIYVAESGNKMVGYIEASGGEYQRNSHKTHIVIGILREYSGKKIGTRLFEHLEKWARNNEIVRLELTVMKHNTKALGLYKKMGFVIEGEIRNSVQIDSKFINEYLMAKLLD